MRIIIDYREHDLYNLMESFMLGKLYSSNLEKENLLLGDIQLTSESSTALVIIERKTIKDLLASIKDGRYNEQSYRLQHSCDLHNHNIIYLIEGDLQSVNGVEQKLTYNSMISLLLYKGFSVFNTKDIHGTMKFIIQMSEKIDKNLVKGKAPYYWYLRNDNTDIPQLSCDNVTDNASVSHNAALSNTSTVSAIEYANVVKKTKKDNITKENIGHIMLCQIPGISANVSKSLMDGHVDFRSFLDALKENPDILNDKVIETSNGKTRKIAKTIIDNVKNYLL